ncbi:MAG: Uridine nucleosidase 1 [Candelina submexicana]|nr:MAG: Uridine nucleosidase 1 [Candelina submexicana]
MYRNAGDAFAILLAAHHPSLELLGISTVHGNASLAQTTANAGSVLTAIGRADVPVYPGASKPFCRDAVYAPGIHGASGLDGTTLLPPPTNPPRADINAIVAARTALLSQPNSTAWLIATGTLTNVALLFATFPEVAQHIKGLSIMGGAIGGGFTDAPMGKVKGEGERIGNWTRWAEFNIYCDPEAAQSIFSNPVLAAKTTLITLDLTHQVLATPEVVQLLLHGENLQSYNDRSHLRQLLHDLLTFFAATYAEVFGLTSGPALHDPLAVAVVLCDQPEYKGLIDTNTSEPRVLEVVTDAKNYKVKLVALWPEELLLEKMESGFLEALTWKDFGL